MNIFRTIPSVLVILLILTGCGEQETNRRYIDQQRYDIEQQEQELASLKKELEKLKNEVIETKIEKGLEKYILTLDIRQSRFSLDIEQHIKDKVNAIQIQLPVDKEYYDRLEIGDVIDDSFRMGSFILTCSYGNWKITVADKEIK